LFPQVDNNAKRVTALDSIHQNHSAGPINAKVDAFSTSLLELTKDSVTNFDGAIAPGNTPGKFNRTKAKDIGAAGLFGNIPEPNPGQQQTMGGCLRELCVLHDLVEWEPLRVIGEKFEQRNSFVEDFGAGETVAMFHRVDRIPLDGRRRECQWNEMNVKIPLHSA
jgi:hypothetical protein